MNPRSWSQEKSSLPIAIWNTQMSKVLDESTVALWAAEAYLVIDTPRTLKKAIVNTVQTAIAMMKGNFFISLKACIESSMFGGTHKFWLSHGTCWKMGSRIK